MTTITRTIPAERRAAACNELAKLVALLNKGAASLSAKIALLGHPDPDQQSKGVMSLARYQTYGELPCRDAVLAIEARLRGEEFEQAKARTVKRHTDQEREEIASNAQRGMIEGDWRDAHLLERLRTLPEETQKMVFSYVSQRALAVAEAAITGQDMKPAQPFAVIEGGRVHDR
jgi:hypothetical protein